MRFRLLKPQWARRKIGKKDNPDFVKEIEGPPTIEGDDYSYEFLKEKNEQGYNIYFFPNGPSQGLPEQQFLSGKDIDTFNYVFVDMDLKDKIYKSKEEFYDAIRNFPLEPKWATDSGNGVHVYWEVEDLDRESFCGIQRMLLKHFKTDESVWTVLQLMRFPGFYNTKVYGHPKEAEYVEEFSSDKVHKVSDFADNLPGLEDEDILKIQRHIDKIEGRNTVGIEITEEDDLPAKFYEDMEKDPALHEAFQNPVEAHGDRSKADAFIAMRLYELDYSREEALAVIMNTKKALGRSGNSRFDYANNTVDYAFMSKSKFAVPNLEQMLKRSTTDNDLGDLVNGPYFMDCLENRWRKKQMLSLIGGSGVGKTAITLKIFKEFIANNPDNDDIFFFFNLEQTVGEIAERWKALVGEDSKWYNRLFVIGQEMIEDSEGGANIQKVYQIVKDTCKMAGKNPGVVCIDHLDALEGDIDLTYKPHFGAAKSKYVERAIGNDVVILSKDGIVQKLKELSKKLNTFLIVHSQTTKEKDGGGDVPLDKNAAYGTSRMEWYSDFMITIWRPLGRIPDKCQKENLFVTAFQYVKNRTQNQEKDEILMGEFRLLKFIPDTQEFDRLTAKEKKKFDELIQENIKIRKAQEKKESTKYNIAPFPKNPVLDMGDEDES